jgi:hypothetical protein
MACPASHGNEYTSPNSHNKVVNFAHEMRAPDSHTFESLWFGCRLPRRYTLRETET